jgi:DinB family protein
MDPITLAALGNFPRQLEAYYAQVPAAFKNWRPFSWDGIPSEPFTPIEQVCHVRDIEVDGYHVRFRRTLQELNPKLISLDGESLARERRYAAASAAEVFTAFRLARAQTIELISTLSSGQYARTAQFEGRSMTVGGLVHHLCSHDHQHLAGLQWLLGQIEACAVAAGPDPHRGEP